MSPVKKALTEVEEDKDNRMTTGKISRRKAPRKASTPNGNPLKQTSHHEKRGLPLAVAVNSDYLDTTHLADNVHDGLYENK